MTKYRRRREWCLPSVSTVILIPQSGRRISDHFFHAWPAVVDFRLLFPIGTQVKPARVLLLDQSVLFRTEPAFEFLFAGDRCIHIAEVLEPDKVVQVITLSESCYFAVLVLDDSASEIVRHSNVESGAML